MPPAATSSRRAAVLPSEQRRAAIIAATRPLLAEFGERVTTRQIAEAAGVAEGTIFRVFADKDELLSATLDAVLDTAALEAALEAIDPAAPFPEQLLDAATIIQRRVVDVWHIVSSMPPHRRSQAARPVADSEGLHALFERNQARIRVEPQVAARLLRALTLSVTHPMLAGEVMSPEEIVEFLLRGIGATA